MEGASSSPVVPPPPKPQPDTPASKRSAPVDIPPIDQVDPHQQEDHVLWDSLSPISSQVMPSSTNFIPLPPIQSPLELLNV